MAIIVPNVNDADDSGHPSTHSKRSEVNLTMHIVLVTHFEVKKYGVTLEFLLHDIKNSKLKAQS